MNLKANTARMLIALLAFAAAPVIFAQINGNPNQAPIAPPPMADWPQQGNDPGAYGANNGSSNVQNGYQFRYNRPSGDEVVVTRIGVCTPNNQRVSYTARLWDVGTQQLLRQGATAIERGWAWSQPGPIRLINGQEYTVTVTGNEWFYLDLNASTQPQTQTRAIWNPTGIIEHMSVRNSQSSTAYPNRPTTLTQDFLWGAADVEYYRVSDLKLTATPEVAAMPQVYSTEKGTQRPNNTYTGISAGSFTVEATNQQYCRLMKVTISGAAGTANLTNALEPLGVALYRDSSGGTVGSYDDADIQIDTWKNFNTQATQAVEFDVTGIEREFFNEQVKRYFVVVKLSGNAAPMDRILLTVSDLDVRTDESDPASGSQAGTGPGAQLTGLEIRTPAFEFTDATGSTRLAYAGQDNYVLSAVDVSYPAGATSTLSSIEFMASGSGHDLDDISQLQLRFDSNGNGSYEPAADQSIAATGAFSGDNGSVTFTLTGNNSFQAGSARRYFLVANLNATPAQGETFVATLIGANVMNNAADVNGLPVGGNAGLEIAGDGLYLSVNGPIARTTINNDVSDMVLLDFSLAAVNEGWNAGTLEFNATGTMDEMADISTVELWADTDGDGAFVRANDTLATSATGTFNASGVYTAALTNPTFNNSLVNAANARRFFLVGSFAGTASSGETLRVSLNDAPNASRIGGGSSQLRNFPATTVVDVAVIGDASIHATFNGPTARVSVDNDSVGSNNNGELILDFTLEGFNQIWNVTSLTFNAASNNSRYIEGISEIALYEDVNDNGVFDNAATDTLATDAVLSGGFNTQFQYIATLRSNARELSGATGSRRFFLNVKFAGSGFPGDFFSAHLASIQATPGGGTVVGAPTANGAGLEIDGAVLTISKAISAPAASIVEVNPTGAFRSVVGYFNFAASNADAIVSSLTLTLSGANGDWLNHLNDTEGMIIPGSNPPTPEYTGTGIQLWQDDGDGIFDENFDTRVFSSAGVSTSSITCSCTPTINVPNGEERIVFVVLNVKDGVAASIPPQFKAEIALPTDVVEDLVSTVVLDTLLPPETSTLTVLDFSVDSITPASGGAGTAIVLEGSGLYQVVNLTIGGQLCGGTPVENSAKTSVSGWTVPANASGGEMVLTTSLVTQTLTQTWSFGGGGGGNGGGCALTDSGSNTMIYIMLLVMGAAVVALRMRASRN